MIKCDPHGNIQRSVDVNLNVLIDSIYISPFADPWFKDSIVEMLEKFTKISSSKVLSSELHQPPKHSLNTDFFREERRAYSKSVVNGYFWVEFDDMESFNKWHEEQARRLHIPFLGSFGDGAIVLNSSVNSEISRPRKSDLTNKVVAQFPEYMMPENAVQLSQSDLVEKGYIKADED